MSRNILLKSALLPVAGLFVLGWPASSQNASSQNAFSQNPAPANKVVPRLEAVAETKLIMDGLAHANFRGLERQLNQKTLENQHWTFARGQALLIAETANLMMLRPPKSPQGQDSWFARAMELRGQAAQLAQSISKKDLEGSRAGLQNVAASCNRCHQTFRVAVQISPFEVEPPPPPNPPKAE